jgi:hypothetical protein
LEQLALRGKLSSGQFRSFSGAIPKVIPNDSKGFETIPMISNPFQTLFNKIIFKPQMNTDETQI